jgi:hypothetical protein
MASRRQIGAGLGVLLALSAATAQPRLDFEIPAQPLASALKQFSARAELQILFAVDDQVLQRPAPAIAGHYRPEEALERLLAGSGLRHTYINSRTAVLSDTRVRAHDGFIEFDQAALSEIVAAFNRHGGRRVRLEDRALANQRVSGRMREENVMALLQLLQCELPVSVERVGGSVVLKRYTPR